MADQYGELALGIIGRNVGQARVEEICQKFRLGDADVEVLYDFVAEWRPQYTVGEVVTLYERYQGRPHLDRILQALEVILWEVGQPSQEVQCLPKPK